MTTAQMIVVEQSKIRPNTLVQRVALFGPDGEPLLFEGSPLQSEGGSEVTSGQVNHLKGRVTKLEKRLSELEGG